MQSCVFIIDHRLHMTRSHNNCECFYKWLVCGPHILSFFYGCMVQNLSSFGWLLIRNMYGTGKNMSSRYWSAGRDCVWWICHHRAAPLCRCPSWLFISKHIQPSICRKSYWECEQVLKKMVCKCCEVVKYVYPSHPFFVSVLGNTGHALVSEMCYYGISIFHFSPSHMLSDETQHAVDGNMDPIERPLLRFIFFRSQFSFSRNSYPFVSSYHNLLALRKTISERSDSQFMFENFSHNTKWHLT